MRTCDIRQTTKSSMQCPYVCMQEQMMKPQQLVAPNLRDLAARKNVYEAWGQDRADPVSSTTVSLARGEKQSNIKAEMQRRCPVEWNG